jgi:hypothetical protein
MLGDGRLGFKAGKAREEAWERVKEAATSPSVFAAKCWMASSKSLKPDESADWISVCATEETRTSILIEDRTIG